MTTTTSKSVTHSNPWLAAMWIVTAITGFIGVGAIAANSDPTARDYDPAAAEIGYVALGVCGVTLASLFVAGAICWQLRQR